MSLINQYRETQAAIAKLQSRLENLKNDSRLQKELEFETRLRELLDEYEKSLPDILALLDNEGKSARNTNRAVREEAPVKRTRRLKVYRNPHNGDTIQTKGGNHKQLKEWKAQWGSEEVESWCTIQD